MPNSETDSTETSPSTGKPKKRYTKKLIILRETLSKNLAFQHITQHVTKPAKLFIKMQLQIKKKPKGRRFSIDEKILSLALFKKTPKCYRLLSIFFHTAIVKGNETPT